ncbi:hypothetical protein CPter291_3586 [Collimonas pratensis]|uniref:Uncharacterized protein n=1 Tax=Collimonas pratensis TaxID=279113 RepID=A0ABM5Z9E5_9BURK|nr:hypothetical protein CPter291_3586 [Collimonas pratensis]
MPCGQRREQAVVYQCSIIFYIHPAMSKLWRISPGTSSDKDLQN